MNDVPLPARMQFLETIAAYTPEILGVLGSLAAVLTTLHIILHKNETRSALGWIGLTWLVPLAGAGMYLMFGINRIRRRAESLRGEFEHTKFVPEEDGDAELPVTSRELERKIADRVGHLGSLANLVEDVIKRPLLPGNHIEPLIDGDEAYPAMIEAIEGAEETITLCTYIFDNDETGQTIADALIDAHERGVDVRVLIDAAGLRYSFPSIFSRLKRGGVEVARFLPSLFPPHLMTFNLRNHRKIMVVDGRVGFTGGINIRDDHWISKDPDFPTRDLHFRLEGPIVGTLQRVFADDWRFTTRETLVGDKWFPMLKPVGDLYARGIDDGPDENINKIPWTVLGAIASAKECIRIVTPYFIPDESIVDALNVAAMRGIRVDVITPLVNNLPFVQWACFGQLRPLLEHGVNVWLTQPPFEHSKLFVVDRYWTMFGSSNWDARSHRLNFEFDVECYDAELGERMDEWAAEKLHQAEKMTLETFDDRPIWKKVRDGTFRLFAPYL